MIELLPSVQPFNTITAALRFCAFAVAIAGLGASLAPLSNAGQTKMIVTWGGNTPEWNQKLHLNAIRMGCSDSPQSCAGAAQKLAQEQHVDRVFVAILLKPSTIDYGRQYSVLSRSHPALYGVGFDDFLRQMQKLHASPGQAGSTLTQFIDGLKSQNPDLKFGVTLYENELASPDLASPELSSVRNRIDFVHLFIHYRADGPDFANYVEQAKRLFPGAQIIAGSYATDRIDYLPCSQKSRQPCAKDQELSLFKKTFDVQLKLLESGSVAGIEFSPGQFGSVENPALWSDPRSCRRSRLDECIAISRQMRDYVANQIAQSNF